MQGFLSELSDLGVMLSLICVPRATGAIFIPLGKATAERVRRRELGAVYESLPSAGRGSSTALRPAAERGYTKAAGHRHARPLKLTVDAVALLIAER